MSEASPSRAERDLAPSPAGRESVSDASPSDAGQPAGDEQIRLDFERGEPAAVAAVRRWIRGASSPFRRLVADELEDVEQEVLLSLTGTLRAGGFEARSSFATYVRRATLYRCINRARNRRRRTMVPVDDLEQAAPEPGPERVAAVREETRSVLRIVGALGAGCRQLWRMIHQGLTYAEMSARLQVAPGTLRVRVLRCRKKALAEWRSLSGEGQ